MYNLRLARRASLALIIAMISFDFGIQSAFAATQNVAATGTWRLYTSQEQTELNIGSNPNMIIGNPSVSSANPQNASGLSPGWTPNGATDPQPTDSRYTSIILDLPKIDVSCSSDVQVNVTSGTADLVDTDFTGQVGFGWAVVNSYNENIIYNDDFISFDDSLNGVGSGSLVSSVSVNPHSVSFGLKLIIGVEIANSSDETAEWDVHDVEASISYEDEGGDCTQTAAPAQATSCDDSYLATQGINVDQPTIDTFDSSVLGEDFEINNIATGNPNDITSPTGLTVNPGLNETETGRTARIIELDISPQSILVGAGTVELHVMYDVSTDLPSTLVMGFVGTADGVLQDWQALNYAFVEGSHTITTYLDSEDLADARIFLIPITEISGDQLSSTISNARVTVSHLQDVAICGIQTTNNTDDPDPTGNGSNLGTLPVTGLPDLELLNISLLLLLAGTAMVRVSTPASKRFLKLRCTK